MRYFSFVLFIFCLSCNNERILQLPEIDNAIVSEVLDVSPAYIFYDETEPDSCLLNRKNLISTTNWLVNVDKRLTLRQAIPQIQFLQNKKRNAQMHKNENAKIFFTCNDTSIGNLGFVEFTDIFFKTKNPDFVQFTFAEPDDYILLKYNNNSKISVSVLYKDTRVEVIENEFLKDFDDLKNSLHNLPLNHIILFFDSDLTFQDYISFKSMILKLGIENLTINANEFLF